MKTLAKASIIGLFLLVICGPVHKARAKAPECTKNGVKYGVVEGNFREEWFSYQERADSYVAGECWEPALSDYSHAVELRTAQDRAAEKPGCDQRRARSYGMHFMDWFGHRGKGIALYNLGRIDDAISELELSLQCTESSQAQYYLDKARAEKLKQTGADTQAPKIKSVRFVRSEPRVDFVKAGSPAPAAGYDRFVAMPYYFTIDEINSQLEGMDKKDRKQLDLTPGWGSQVISWKSADEIPNLTVNEGAFYAIVESEDDQGVQFVDAAGVKSPYTFAQKTRADVFPLLIKAAAAGDQEQAQMAPEDQETQDLFAISLNEDEGKARLAFTVTDLTGKTAQTAVELAIDREGPQISIQDAKMLPGGKAQIKGTWDDASGIKEFKIGGVAPSKSGPNGFEVTAPLETADRVRFQATDPAGNTTTGVIVLGPVKGTMIQPPVRWTRLFDKLYRLASLDAFDAPVLAVPPRSLQLDPWTMEPRGFPQIPDLNQPLRLAADVELYWNELQNTLGTAPKPPQIVLKTRPQTVYSNQLYVEGSVVGQGANVKTILIQKKNVLSRPRLNAFFNKLVYLRPGKNIILVQAVDENGLKSDETLTVNRVVPRVDSVAERLGVSMLPFYQDPAFMDIGSVAYDNLVTALVQQRRFRYVDRSKVDQVVRELRLSGTGLTDPATAVRAGKQSSSEAIIIGVVIETATSIEVKAQVVDVETSRIMVTRDAYHQDKSLSNLQFICRGLAAKLQNAFPIVSGNIQGASGKNATITLGRRNRIVPGMKLVVFKVVPKTDPSGETIGADTRKIGEATVMAISSSASTIQLTQGSASGNDMVITK
ncbi:MAG TPA: CsgG/HfaB family protein [bacterium]|nr:CsgG/HfaB family protein [bacterium]